MKVRWRKGKTLQTSACRAAAVWSSARARGKKGEKEKDLLSRVLVYGRIFLFSFFFF